VNEIAQKAIGEMERQGFKAKTISVQHLPELQEDIDKFQRQGLLDKHLTELYLQFKYDTATALPDAATVFIISIPQPVTRARFAWRGRVCIADVPPTYIGRADDARVKKALTGILEPAGFRLERARLPAKTLAVRGGLARYGRNNITYIPGFGSYQRLLAFFSDCPCQQDNWGELKMMAACEKCFKCGENCPTRCIPTDRFLLHAENCLTWQNEQEKALAAWIKPEWHNALIGCMRCQLVCPVNKNQVGKIVPGPLFSEEETDLLLRKPPLDKLPEELRRKLAAIAMDDSYDVFARNLDVLMKSQDLRPPTP